MSFGMFQLKFWSKARRGAVLGSCYWGSGDILVVKSSDKVEVGDANAFMMLSCGKKRRFQWFPMIPPFSKMFFFGVPQVLGRVSKAQFWLPWCLVPPLQSGQFLSWSPDAVHPRYPRNQSLLLMVKQVPAAPSSGSCCMLLPAYCMFLEREFFTDCMRWGELRQTHESHVGSRATTTDQDVVEQQTPNQAKSTKNKSTIIISSYMFILIHYISCINNSIWFLFTFVWSIQSIPLLFSSFLFFSIPALRRSDSLCQHVLTYFSISSAFPLLFFLVVYTVYTRCVHSVLECFLWSTSLIFSKLTGPEDPWSVWGDPGPWKVQN